MKILVSSRFHIDQYLAGAERYAHDIACSLSQDHQVIMATTSKVNSNQLPYQVVNYHDSTLGNQPTFNRHLLQIIDRINPDAYHAIGISLHHLFPMLTKSSRYLKIISLLAPSSSSNPMFRSITNLETKMLIRQSHAASTLTPNSFYHSQYSPYAAKLFPVSPILPKSFVTPSSKIASKKQSKRSSQKTTVLQISKLDSHHYYKGVSTSLQALSLLPKDSFQLILVGSGDKLTHYQQKASKLDLDNNVSFMGQASQAELQQLLQKSDILIAPSSSNSEGFGISIIEAMAYQIPVITTSVVGLAPQLKNKQLATIIPPKDPNHLAQAILKISKTPRSKLPLKAAKQFALAHNQKQLTKQLESLYLYANSQNK